MSRPFSSRDRRALSLVLAAGLRHAQIDELVSTHPVPGDPGHDAGKAGRIGLYVATMLAGRDQSGLIEALALIEPERIAPTHAAAAARLRRKAGLSVDTPVTPGPAPAQPPDLQADQAAQSAELDEDVPHVATGAPVVVLEQLDEQQASVQVVVQALVQAGVQVIFSGHRPVPAGALVLRPAGAG